ncbi:PaaI family thioesterase [Micrococcus luteus]
MSYGHSIPDIMAGTSGLGGRRTAEDAENTGPRAHPQGRTEQLFGVRRHGQVRQEGAHWNPGYLLAGPSSIGLDGRPTAAAATVLMDNATAVAVHHAAAGAMEAIVTTELTLNVLKPMPAFNPSPDAEPEDQPRMECWYTPLTVDAGGGAARAWLVDAEGDRVVEATGWFQAVPAAPPVSLDAFVRHGGLPLGPETRVPMAELVGLDPDSVTAQDDAVRPAQSDAFAPGARFRQNSELDNPQGAVHGGAMMLRAILAAQGAMPDRALYDVQAVRTVYTRPGHGDMVAMTRVRHAGRSLRFVDVELVPLAENGTPVADKPMVQVQVTFRAART